MTFRNSIFDYLDLETREQYTAHREDFDKNVDRWKLTPEVKALFARATEIAWDTETVPEAPVGSHKYIQTDGVRSKLGLSYLTEITHIAFYAVVDGQDVAVVLVAPFTEEEEAFIKWIIEKEDKLDIGHNQAFDVRITCGHRNIKPPKQTYCTLVAQTTMMGGPNMGYPGGYRRSLDSLMDLYDIQHVIEPYVMEAAIDWSRQTLGDGNVEEYAVRHHVKELSGTTSTSEFGSKLVVAWQKFMKDNRGALHTLPAKWVAAYAISDSVATYWLYKSQVYWAHIMQEQYGYHALYERMVEDQQYQNVLNKWTVRGMPVNRKWMQDQIALIKKEKERLLVYFKKIGVGDLTKASQKYNFIFNICDAPKPDPWELVEFESGYSKWYPAEMQNQLWTKSAFTNISQDGWDDNRDYSKWYSTGSDAVDYYIQFGPEMHRSKLRLYKYYTSMVSMEATYREWLDHSSYDGSVHPILTMTANSGRTIGDTPNPLNVPMHAPHMLEVYDPATGRTMQVTEFTGRGMFKPHDGKVLMEFDASNAEVRFAAVVAKAKGLASAFAEKRDLHSENAAAFNRIPVERVSKDQRTRGKPIFFAMQYGGGARTIASRVLQPVDEVSDMIRGWEEVNWEVGEAKKRIEDEGFALYQRMQQFPLIAGQQAYTVLYNGRWVPAPMQGGRPKLYTLWNSQQQGGVAGVVAASVIATDRWLAEHPEYNSDMYIMVHDSIIAEVPEDDWEAAKAVGEYISMQLSTQVPLDMTVVDGIPVPWPSGCDLYENQHKWGWRADADFPYDCGQDEGEVVITYPEDKAWEIMQDKALDRLEGEFHDLIQEIRAHQQAGPVKEMLWYDMEHNTHTCITWKNTVQYSPEEHYAQSRYWGAVIQQPGVDANVKAGVKAYRDWVSVLYDLDQKFQKVKAEYERTKEFRIPTSASNDG